MPTDVNHDNTAYRRGLVLGYTMAEIVLLIIFILLLLTSFINFKKNKEIKSLENELEQNKNSLQKYKPLLDETSKRFSDVNDFNDLFQKLILAERNKEKDKEIVQKLNHLQNKANLLKEINTKLKERLHTEVNDKSISSEIDKIIEYNNAFDELLKDENKDLSISKKLQKVRDLQNIQGQYLYTQNQLEKCKGLGKGSSYPPCWVNKSNGKTEYIFNISITDNGYIIKSNIDSLPHRYDEYGSLPIQQIKTKLEINDEVFANSTFPLFKYSQEKNCRFYVRLYDQTGPNQKEIYKKRMKAVEGHFYKFINPNNF